MWSPVERTALADAEVEYHDHVSPTIWVKFPVVEGSDAAPRRQRGDLDHHALDHPGQPRDQLQSRHRLRASIEVEAHGGGPGVRALGQARRPADPRRQAGRRGDAPPPRSPSGARLEAVDPRRAWSAPTRWPALDAGYGFPVPLLAGDHVTDDAGTGFVHTAPGHGADDYLVWLAHGHREIPETVDPDGAYYRPRAAVRRAEGAGDRGQEGRQVRPGQRRGDREADRGRRPAGARPAGAQLSALLALQGAGDLPQHAAVVHPHGRAAGGRGPRRPHPARDGAGGHRRHRLLSRGRPQPHPLHGREPARLADQPPARLGLAAGHVRRQGDRPAAARRGGQRPHRRPDRRRGRRRLVHPARPATSSATTTPSATRRSRTSSTSGSIPARPTPSRWRAAPTPAGRPTSTWKAPTSTAAGSSRRCWKAPAPAAARPTTRS